MKIVVAGIYPPDVGGPATYAALVEQELPVRGIEVRVVPFRSVRHLPALIRHGVYVLKLFGALLRADAILVQDTVSSGLPGLLAARMAWKPFVVRVGGDYAWEQSVQRYGVTEGIDEFQLKRYGWRVEFLRSIQRFVVRRADRVIAPSHYLAGIVDGWLGDKGQSTVIYNGIEIPPAAAVINDRPEGFLVVSAGRLVPWKGFDEVIEAIAKERTWTLVIIGDGPEREHLEVLVNELQASDRIHFTGNLSREVLHGWIQSADAFVLNSSYEGLSHVLIEAQALGTPVVASNIPGNKEVVEDGENGLLVPLHDSFALRSALRSIADDHTRAAQLGAGGKAHAGHYAIRATMDALAQLLKTL